MVTIGLSLTGHDRSLCILDEAAGEPIAFVEDERYSRVKGGRLIGPPESLLAALSEFGVAPSSITCLALSSIPAHIELRPAASRAIGPPFGYARVEEILERRVLRLLPAVERIARFKHHLCHAASTFFPSRFDEAAVLTVDGKGEDESATIYLGQGDALRRIAATPLPHSLGYLYSNVAFWAGLRGYECEGKLMGLAAYGSPTRAAELRKTFLGAPVDGQIRLARSFVDIPCSRPSWQQLCEEALGPARRPDQPLTTREWDVAASVQRLVEEELLRLVADARRLTSARRLCLGGGVFLNSVANGMITRSGIFDEVYVPPWPGDTGLAAGAAFLAGPPGRLRQADWPPFLGSAIDDGEVATLARSRGVPFEQYDAERVADSLSDGRIVGWVRGRMEVGPRALGNRSILAHPGRPGTKDRLNRCVKNREQWRPFAPVVLQERAADYFEMVADSPFMNVVFRARERALREAPEAIHVDGTARVQTLRRADNPHLYELLDAFAQRTGLPLLLNTSCNVQGEPIVRTAEEAIETFLTTEMDLLVLGGLLLRRPEVSLKSAAAPRFLLSAAVSRELGRVRRVRLLAREFTPASTLLADMGLDVQQLVDNALTADLRAIAHAIAQCPNGELLVIDVPVPASLSAELLPAVLASFAAHHSETVVFGDDRCALLLHEELLSQGGLATPTEFDHIWTSAVPLSSRHQRNRVAGE